MEYKKHIQEFEKIFGSDAAKLAESIARIAYNDGQIEATKSAVLFNKSVMEARRNEQK